MLDTYTIVLLHSLRNFKKNFHLSPILYIIFMIMIFFSIIFLAFITAILMNNKISIDISNIFFLIVFLFIIKSSHDFYQLFTRNNALVYVLSTEKRHLSTIFQIFLVNFWLQLGIWVILVSVFWIVLYFIGINPSYPFLYLKFISGVIIASILGSLIAFHFFSHKKYRLFPIGLFLSLLIIYSDYIEWLLIVIVVSTIYLIISFKDALNSYLYIPKIQRKQEKSQIWLSSPKKALFYKELVILWRDKIYFSIVFSAVFLGLGTGYIGRYGIENILPSSFSFIIRSIPPEMYAFFGIYILVIHSAVFISLNVFLNEEKTIWLLRHLPISYHDIIKGKMFAIVASLFCSLPFIFYFMIFHSIESLPFLLWFLVFSFLSSMIICFPLGAKYVGRKSDILLLYSVSLIEFLILSIAFSWYFLIDLEGIGLIFWYILPLVIEIFILYFISMNLTAKILSLSYSQYT